MKKNFKKEIINTILIKSKACNPFVFPFLYLASKSSYIIRRNIRSTYYKIIRKPRSINQNNILELEKDGCTKIEKFLSEKTFINLINELKLLESDNNKSINEKLNIENFGNSFRIHFRKNNLEELPVSSEVFEGLSKILKDISSHLFQITSGYYELHEGDDDGQNNETFHTDIYQPTFKCFLYLEDVESFPYEFIKGTHSLSLENGIWHLKCQVKNYIKNIKSCRNPIHQILSIIGLSPGEGSWRINFTKHYMQKDPIKLKNSTKTFLVKKNTLVIADTSGLHRKSPNNYASTKKTRKLFFVGERSFIFI